MIKLITERYPAQTFIDSQVAEKLDLQSGSGKNYSNGRWAGNMDKRQFLNKKRIDDIGGLFKDTSTNAIMNKLTLTFIHLEPKVIVAERNNGLDGMEEKAIFPTMVEKSRSKTLIKETTASHKIPTQH